MEDAASEAAPARDDAPAGGRRSVRERQAEFRERQRQRGNRRLSVYVPEDKYDACRLAVKRIVAGEDG